MQLATIKPLTQLLQESCPSGAERDLKLEEKEAK